MLEQQAWMQYAKELPLEWRQAMDEGREVEDLIAASHGRKAVIDIEEDVF